MSSLYITSYREAAERLIKFRVSCINILQRLKRTWARRDLTKGGWQKDKYIIFVENMCLKPVIAEEAFNVVLIFVFALLFCIKHVWLGQVLIKFVAKTFNAG